MSDIGILDLLGAIGLYDGQTAKWNDLVEQHQRASDATDQKKSCRLNFGPIVSTPCQPAYACLARSVSVKTGQCRALSEWKMREIKGLGCKLLKCLSYLNRWGFGS